MFKVQLSTPYVPTLSITATPIIVTQNALITPLPVTAVQPALVVPGQTATSPVITSPLVTATPGSVNSAAAGTCAYPAGWVAYTVQTGDTLSTIASRVSVPVTQLMASNCLTNADVIDAGQVIYIPANAASAAQAGGNVATAVPPTSSNSGAVAPSGTCAYPAGWVAYTVQSGDTLSTIASRIGVPVTQLIAANCLTNADVIDAGQVIYIPATAAAPSAVGTAAAGSGPSIANVWVEPAVVNQGQYVVANGTKLTVRAGGVTNASKVTFVLQPVGSTAPPTMLGADTDLSDGVSITWTVNDPNLQANLWAIATNSANESTQTTPIVIVVR